MKTLTKLLTVILCVTLIFPLTACNKLSTVDFTCFNTAIHISVKGKPLTKSTENKIKNTLYSLENEFNVDNGTFTSSFNNGEINKPTSISATAKDVLDKTFNAVAFTDGKFNPLVYPFVKLWGFSTDYPVDNFTPISSGEIESLLSSAVTDVNSISYTNDSITKYKDVKMDLGGILKGYALDKIAEILTELNYKDGYVSIGSSSIYVLSAPSFAIRHPENKSGKILSIKTKTLKDFSISTSGTYERYYDYNSVRYSHLIDPKMGVPVNTGVLSATVTGVSGTMGDALSTALCISKYTPSDSSCELITLINKILTTYTGAKIYVVINDGKVKELLTNEKESDNYTLFDEDYSVITLS